MNGVTVRVEGARPRRFCPYRECRDPGVEWLGEIPAHWDITRVCARYEVPLSKADSNRMTALPETADRG